MGPVNRIEEKDRIKMKKYSRGGGSGKKNFTRSSRGPRKFSGDDLRRPGPDGKGKRGEGRKLYSAFCSVCGAQCQVPFRPDGSRPIYCRDCFRKQDSGGGGREEFRREERVPRRLYPRREGRPIPSGPDQSDLVRLLEKIDGKLDRILEALGSSKEEEE